MSDIESQINEKKTCRELIEEKLLDREEYMDSLFKAIDADEPFNGYEDASDDLYDFALGYNVRTIVDIQLSTGGPADWLEVHVDNGGKFPVIEGMKYHYSDWFDHAVVTVDVDSPFYRYVETIIESILY